MDFSGPITAKPPPFLHVFSQLSAMREAKVMGGASVTAASASYANANQGRYVPIHNPWWYPVRRVFWVNGSAVTGNRDFGIYTFDSSPRRIYSTGSTAAAGASAPQYVTPGTPFWLPPGDYFFAFNCTATTNAVFGGGAQTRMAGWKEQAIGAVTLPDPLVPAVASTGGPVPIMGVTWTPSGF